MPVNNSILRVVVSFFISSRSKWSISRYLARYTRESRVTIFERNTFVTLINRNFYLITPNSLCNFDFLIDILILIDAIVVRRLDKLRITQDELKTLRSRLIIRSIIENIFYCHIYSYFGDYTSDDASSANLISTITSKSELGETTILKVC